MKRVNITILVVGILLTLIAMSITARYRFNYVREAQAQIISNQETIIILLSPKYSHDIESVDKMKVIQRKVEK